MRFNRFIGETLVCT